MFIIASISTGCCCNNIILKVSELLQATFLMWLGGSHLVMSYGLNEGVGERLKLIQEVWWWRKKLTRVRETWGEETFCRVGDKNMNLDWREKRAMYEGWVMMYTTASQLRGLGGHHSLVRETDQMQTQTTPSCRWMLGLRGGGKGRALDLRSTWLQDPVTVVGCRGWESVRVWGQFLSF